MKGNEVIHSMDAAVIVLLKPDIVVIIIDIFNGKEKFLLTVKVMVECTAGGA